MLFGLFLFGVVTFDPHLVSVARRADCELALVRLWARDGSRARAGQLPLGFQTFPLRRHFELRDVKKVKSLDFGTVTREGELSVVLSMDGAIQILLPDDESYLLLPRGEKVRDFTLEKSRYRADLFYVWILTDEALNRLPIKLLEGQAIRLGDRELVGYQPEANLMLGLSNGFMLVQNQSTEYRLYSGEFLNQKGRLHDKAIDRIVLMRAEPSFEVAIRQEESMK